MAPPTAHASPYFVKDGHPAAPLRRLDLSRSPGDDQPLEDFVQDLVHDHPDIIPMHDIEPAFTPLISICKELPTRAGSLDNLWLTPDGGIVLGECKLFRNPQARREVIAQGLDYARAMAEWHFEDLEAAVRKTLKAPDASLWAMVRERSPLDEAAFIDAVDRRLRASRFLILIIGDGIREGVEVLTNSLQLHAGIHAAVALVDLSIWHGVDGGLLVVPRIPMRTVLVERGIVIVEPAGSARVEAPRAAATSAGPRTTTLSEEEFYQQLEGRRPGVSGRLRAFLDEIEALGIVPEFQKSLVLRWYPAPEVRASAGYVETSGRVWLGDAWYFAQQLGNISAGETYLATMVDAIGGTILRPTKPSSAPQVRDPGGHLPDVAMLLDAAETWKAALARLISETKSIDD